MSTFAQQLVNGVVIGSLYGLIALGYTMVYGIIQLINFAHGEIFMIGAFGGLAVHIYVLPDGTPALVGLVVVLLAAMATSVATALIVERFAYRPLRNAPRLAPLITAIGVSLFLQEFVRLYYFGGGAKSDRAFPQFIGGDPIRIGGVQFDRVSVFIVVIAIVLMVALSAFVRNSKTGKAMQATAQDRDTAQLMGINTDRIIIVAFVLGAALAGVAGVMQGMQAGVIGFRMGFLAGIKAFTAAVLGGIGNIAGAVLGGFVLGMAETMAVAYIPGLFGGGAWKDVWAFILLIVILVFRPQGLLGERVVNRA
ncbi:MAG TPA: branched-chain amino acid ABC transporter permease [Frankiaceae bacterium]|nr:branched-chain amino acid ABC transporter permease [Frankiaceae bacterium]